MTDHKPLTVLFNPTKAIPSMSSARIQRWALFLMDYQYKIQFRSTGNHANTDALSRLPIKEKELLSTETVSLLQLRQIEDTLLTAKQIANSTCKNPVLSQVLQHVKTGWPNQVPTAMQPFANRKEELAVEGNCLLWGARVIIPPDLQPKMSKLLHETHPGITRMKSLARSYVWWPGIDKDLECIAKSCQDCQQHQKVEQKTPLHPLEFPKRPWQRLHLDFAGPFQGQMWLIVIDAYSKWSIKHSKTAPYHPQSNGAAERFVQTFKQAMKKMKGDTGDVKKKLAEFLLRYRKTPHATTSEAPAMLLMKRIPRSRIDLCQPKWRDRVEEKQEVQKKTMIKMLKARSS